ncbi:MAG: hypothetical protein ACXW08_14190, partial [Solirubrobacteraceae bacterium]
MTTVRRRTLLVLLCLLCSPAAAAALPGDATFGPLSPPDGATLPVDPDGIPVSYTCPVYRVADPGFPLFGGPKDYGVSLSTSPAIGADGRLADAAALNTGSADSSVGPDGCSAALGAGGPPPRIQETPGRYSWQVWRICTGCEGDYEVGPVRTFTLRSSVKPSLRAPGRAYAGYAFFVTAQATGVPDGTKAVVQRRSGTRWRSVGSATVLGGEAEAPIVLARGTQQVRVSVTIGAQQVASAARRVKVRRARRWSTGAAADGRYKGRAGARSVRLKVAGRQAVRSVTSVPSSRCCARAVLRGSSRPRSARPPSAAPGSLRTAASWPRPPRTRTPRSACAGGCSTARCRAGA